MQQRAGDVVRDVGDYLEWLTREGRCGIERERVGLDQREAIHRAELAAQPCRQPWIELDGHHRCAGLQQASGEHAQTGPHLHHAIAGCELRSVDDGVQHRAIGEEVLAQRTAGLELLRRQQAA